MKKTLIASWLCLSLTLVAQEAVAPTLTDVQKLTLQVKYLQFENDRLKLEKSQADLLSYVQSLQKEGYAFDISSMTYAPLPEKK